MEMLDLQAGPSPQGAFGGLAPQTPPQIET